MDKFDTTVVQKQRDHNQRRRGGELNPTSYEYVTCNTHQMREDYTLLYTVIPKLCVSNGYEDTRLLLNLCAHTKT